jgi:hypothetical protein
MGKPPKRRINHLDDLHPVTGSSASAVSLIDLRQDHCKAIIDYVDGNVWDAVYCGLPIIMGRDGMPSSWCEEHHARFMVSPRAPRPERSFAFKWRPSSVALSTAAA